MNNSFVSTERSTEPEIMDDFTCSGAVVERTLKELDLINQLLGGNGVTLSGLKRMTNFHKASGEPLTIADLGCGSGDLLRRFARYARKKGINAKLIGLDANPSIVEYARKHSVDYPEISFDSVDVLSADFAARNYDIICGTLFFHHFDNDTLEHFLPQLVRQAKLGVLINDIHRHWLAFHSIRWLTRWLSSSSMVRFDAPLSVRRAFTRDDWMRIFAKAKLNHYRISWRWAFRWKIMLSSSESRLAQFW
jgi:ubiquinone/menaquinone biosynthesis C-methylase UbiE